MTTRASLAQDEYIRLDVVYSCGCIIILSIGGLLTLRVLYLYFKFYTRLNSITKSFICILIPDACLVLNFLPRTIYTSRLDHIPMNGWCTFSAFLATVVMVALNFGTVCVSYTTWRLTCLKPVPDMVIWVWNVVSWVVGIILASLYMISDDLGPYKGLYCCIKEVLLSRWSSSSDRLSGVSSEPSRLLAIM